MKNLFLSIYLILTIGSIFSYQWPSNKDFLKSFFGTSLGSSVQDGVKFFSNEQAIYPLSDGEIIYYQDDFSFGENGFHGDDGNVMVLTHVGEFKSVYRNFTAIENFDNFKSVNETEMLGIANKNYDDFIFSIYDDKIEAYINPQQLLPFLEDKRNPVISSVYLENQDIRIKISRNKVLPSGESRLYIDCWDVVKISNKLKKFIPFSIYVFIDGFERYNTSFSSIKELDGELYLGGDSEVSVKDLLSGEGLIYGGDVFLTRGRSLVEVVVRDIDGNEASKSYPVLVE